MKYLLLSLLVIATSHFTLNAAIYEKLPNDETKANNNEQAVISWNSLEGINRLESAQSKVDFFKLANHFESQHNKLFCGPTSATIVLNSLRVRNGDFTLPRDPALLREEEQKHFSKKPNRSVLYQRYTQNNILDISPKTRAMILGEPMQNDKGEKKPDYGLQLHQLAQLLQAHNAEVQKVVVGDEANSDEIKRILVNNLTTADDYVIVNFLRGGLSQPGGGHISPLGAYHQASDSFLILDTAPNKSDWVWVKSETLINAMRTFDKIENRGFVVVKNKSE